MIRLCYVTSLLLYADVDECSENATLCSAIEGQICDDLVGSFNCSCPPGTEVLDGVCVGMLFRFMVCVHTVCDVDGCGCTYSER